MIPENLPEMESFLGSLSRVSGPAKGSLWELVPSRSATDGNRRSVTPPFIASYDEATGVTPEAATKRVAKELQGLGHDTRDEVVRAFMAIYASTSRQPGRAIERLNNLLALVSTGEVSDYLLAVFPAHPDTKPFAVREFRVGPVDYPTLVTSCRRERCDYFDRYPGLHRNCFAVSRLKQPVKALDFARLMPLLQATAPMTLADAYFEALTNSRREQFATDFWEAQVLPMAAGAPYIDARSPLTWQGSTFVSLYHAIGPHRAGFFCPMNQGVGIDFAQIDKRLPAVQTELERSYRVQNLASDAGQTLLSFSRFIAQARRHQGQGRQSEAFLHHIIALDLVFGDKEMATQSVVRRTAVCLYGDLEQDFKRSIEDVKALYEARSRYVHAGKHPSEEQLRLADTFSTAVMRCLLRRNRDSQGAEVLHAGSWLKQLDFVASGIEAGHAPESGLLVKLSLRD